MPPWHMCSGSRGQHELKFLDKGRVHVALNGLDVDLGCAS